MPPSDESTPSTQERDDGADFAIATTSLDTRRTTLARLRGLRSARGRAFSVAATSLLVVAVLVGLFIHSSSDPGGALATLLRASTPTPDATFVPGANVVYFSDGVPWGTLSVDGKRIPTPDIMGGVILISRGAHHLDYQARYFPSLHCVFSAPRALSDTCPLNTSQQADQFLLDYGLARVLDLGSTGDRLQSDQRDAIIQHANTILAAHRLTAAIAPGDHYLDGQGHVVTATAPLRFTLTLALGGSNSPGFGAGCLLLCTDENQQFSGIAYDGKWHVTMNISPSWAITDASGRPLTAPNYRPAQNNGDAPIPMEAGIQLTPQGWTIDSLWNANQQVVSMIAQEGLSQAMSAAPSTLGASGYSESYMIGTNPLDGCVMDVTFSAGLQVTARVLWRFGALLAMNDTARKAFRQLPVANAAEQAQAARIIQQWQQQMTASG